MEYVRSEYAVGWGTLALLNAGLAQAKGKSGPAPTAITAATAPAASPAVAPPPAGGGDSGCAGDGVWAVAGPSPFGVPTG